MKFYAAYGSDMNAREMKKKCPGAIAFAKSWIHDHHLVFQGYRDDAQANVIPAEGYDVPVIIWCINEYHEKELDFIKAVRGYEKSEITLEVDGKLEKCVIYIRGSEPFGIPLDRYLRTIAEAYNDFNFDIRILNEAVKDAHKYTLVFETA